MFLKNLIKNNGFTLLELLVVLAVLAILLGLVSPNFGLITERATQAVQTINAKMFSTNAIYDLALNNRSNVRISETVNLSSIGEVQDVEVQYEGTDTLNMLVSTDGGDSWHSYTLDEQASLKDMFGGYAKAIKLNWELVDHSTPANIKEHALSIEDFNSLGQAEWLEILENAEVVTFAFNATDEEGNDITWDINPELSIVVTGADGTESVVFPEDTADNTGEGTETPSQTDITLPADSSNLFADGTHRDNGDSTNNYDLVNANTDSAANFNGMFSNAGSFNQDIGGWNTSNVTDFGDMFNGSSSFDQDLSGWNFSSATNVSGIAQNAGFSQDNYNRLVDAIYNTNTQSWGISDITNDIGTTDSITGYTGGIEDNNVSVKANSISAGKAWHATALKQDGSLISWGSDGDNRVSDTPTGNDFVAVDAGGYHSLALKEDGSLVSWGYDGYYRVVSNTPTGNDFVAISAGSKYSLALKEDGSLVAWGNDYYNQVSDTPAGNDFVAIDAGGYHSLALKEDGSLVSWGRDRISKVVTDTPTGNDFVAVDAGSAHSLALKEDGSLVVWGGTGDYQLPTGNDFVAISTSYSTASSALKSDGSIISWGKEEYNNQVTDTPTGNDFVAISVGANLSLALKKDGTLVSWGDETDYNMVSTTPTGNDF